MPFDLSKFIQTLIEPGNLLVVLLLLCALLAVSSWDGGQRLGRRLGLFLSLLLFLVAAFPVGEWAMVPLENKHAGVSLPAKVDGLVLLTGDENPALMDMRGRAAGGAALGRYLHLAELAKKYPSARIVITGNTAPHYNNSKTTTKTVSQSILETMGVNAKNVIFEEKALTTFENARFTAQLVKPQKDDVWVAVTSAYHMPRAVLCFEKQNMKVVPSSSDYFTGGHYHLKPRLNLSRQLMLLTTAVHEYYGLLGYWFAGWIERPW